MGKMPVQVEMQDLAMGDNELVLRRVFDTKPQESRGWFDRWTDKWFDIPQTENQAAETLTAYDTALKQSERVEKYVKVLLCYVFGVGFFIAAFKQLTQENYLAAKLSLSFMMIGSSFIVYYSLMYLLKLSNLMVFIAIHKICSAVPRFRPSVLRKSAINTISFCATASFLLSLLPFPYYAYYVVKLISK